MSDGLKYLASIIEAQTARDLRTLDPELFVDNERAVFEFVRNHFREYGVLPDLQTIATETRVRLPSISEPIDYYKRRLFDRRIYMEVRDRFNDLRDAMTSNDMRRVTTVVDQMYRSTRMNTEREDLRSYAQLTPRGLRAYDDRSGNPGITGVPSGWPYLDEMTSGFKPGDFVAFIARPELGKTYLMLQAAHKAWQAGYFTLFVSMEMPLLAIVNRLFGVATQINPNYIKRGMLSTAAYGRLQDYVSGLVGGDQFMFYSGAFNKSVSAIEVLVQELQPDIVFIDGAYILRPNSSNERAGRYERIAQTFDELAEMRLRLPIPLIVSSQFGRGAGRAGKSGSLENIAFTDAVGHHCTIIMSIKEGKTPHQRDRRIIEILKGREGERGVFTVHYTFAPVKFEQVDDSTIKEESPDLDWMEQ
jgi:replicative DNA helicase